MSPLTERFEMRLDEETLAEIEAWRIRQSDTPSRAEAIRRLVEKGLVNHEPKLHFTSGETLILHMLCDLFEQTKVRSEYKPALIRQAMLGGHLWGLEWEYPFTLDHAADDPAIVSEVGAILDMWFLIEIALKRMSQKDQKLVDKSASFFRQKVEFPGFDGNDEPAHFGIARFLVDDLGRFEHFKGRDLNSHAPFVESYRRMLKVWKPIRATISEKPLTAAQIIEIVNSRLPAEQSKGKNTSH